LEKLNVDPAGGPVNGGEQILPVVLIRHLGQVFHSDVHEARCVILEGLMRGGLHAVLCRQQGLEVGDPMAAQTAVESGSGKIGVDERVTASRSSRGSRSVLRSSTTTAS